MSSVTLPTNGKDFRAFVTVSFNASGIFLATGDPISANGSANGYIDFVYIDGAYYPGAFKETPEPGTLALVGTGVLGIVARTKNRFLKFTRGKITEFFGDEKPQTCDNRLLRQRGVTALIKVSERRSHYFDD